MTPREASAPGKIMLAGEYAVIDGAQAVMLTVNRRAVARVHDEAQVLSPFLAAARDLLDNDDARARAQHTVVNTQAFASDGGIKLGLGSSAAATVSAVACALQSADKARVHAIAHRAHAAAQATLGARGSGADIAACVHGGVVVVRRESEDGPLAARRTELPAGLTLVWVWTESAASTPALVAQVRALRDSDSLAYDRATARIAGAAARLVDALGVTGSATRAVDALRLGGEAVTALGDAAGAQLWTEAHTRLRTALEPLGGAVKPTGAGGGDIALAAFADTVDADAVDAALTGAGMQRLPLTVDSIGVTLAS